jgi:peroxiredoxin
MENDLTLFKKVAAKMDQFNPNSDLTKTLKMHILAFENRKQEQTAEKSLVAVGQMAPEVMIPGIDGKEISLSMFRGNYVLLDFWAAWCRPCRAENPNLAAVYKRYHTKGLVIFQISLDKNRADWLKAIRDDKLNWVHGCDFGFWETASARLYNVASIPTNFLIDPSGKIVATNLRGAELTKKMKEVYLY